MARELTHNIGDRISTYEIIEISREKYKFRYVTKCSCGQVNYYTSTQLKKRPKCQYCRINNLIGKKNHKSLFLKYIGKGVFECICDCGNKFIGRARQKSCGCHIVDQQMQTAKEKEGLINGGIKILRFLKFKINKYGHQEALYKAKCKCGKIIEVTSKNIGSQKTCGCRIVNNYARGERQGNSKRTKEEVLNIRELFLTGQYSKGDLAEMFSLKIEVIHEVINCKSWKHVEVDPRLLEQSIVKKKFGRRLPQILPGMIFSQWTVLEKRPSKKGHGYWLCKCSCGNIREVIVTALHSGRSTKCYDCNAKNFAKWNKKK